MQNWVSTIQMVLLTAIVFHVLWYHIPGTGTYSTSYYVRLKSFVHVRAVVLIVALQIHEVLVGRLKEPQVR